jgi:hypothetical protein
VWILVGEVLQALPPLRGIVLLVEHHWLKITLKNNLIDKSLWKGRTSRCYLTLWTKVAKLLLESH